MADHTTPEKVWSALYEVISASRGVKVTLVSVTPSPGSEGRSQAFTPDTAQQRRKKP